MDHFRGGDSGIVLVASVELVTNSCKNMNSVKYFCVGLETMFNDWSPLSDNLSLRNVVCFIYLFCWSVQVLNPPTPNE